MGKKKNGKDTSVIPRGYCCYSHKDGKEVICPYWRRIEGRPHQEDGYCDYLEEGDLEINADTEEYDPKTGKISDSPINVGLLWDMVKECGENHWTDEEWEEMKERGEIKTHTLDKPIELPDKKNIPILRRRSKR